MAYLSFTRLTPAALALVVSLISLRMTAKCLLAKAWLRFHETAAAVEWHSLTPQLQQLLLFMVKVAGLGFLVLFLLLALVPTYLYWHPDRYLGFACLCIGIIFCVGLGMLNRWLHRVASTDTPWTESFVAAGLLAFAAVLSLLPT